MKRNLMDEKKMQDYSLYSTNEKQLELLLIPINHFCCLGAIHQLRTRTVTVLVIYSLPIQVCMYWCIMYYEGIEVDHLTNANFY